MLRNYVGTKIQNKVAQKKDMNTKFFYHTANRKRNKDHIPLLEIYGEKSSNRDAIFSAFSNFYRELMGTTDPFSEIGVNWEQYYLAESHPYLLDLEESFTEEEI